MSIRHQLAIGFRTHVKAIELIFIKRWWWTFLFPLLLNLLLFIGGYAFIDLVTTEVQQWILNLVALNNSHFLLSDVLTGFISGIVQVILNVFFFFLFAYYGGYVALILLFPLLAYLSERTDQIITGKKHHFNPAQWIRDIVRGMLIAFRNLFIETGWFIFMFVISFIPIIGWLGVPVLFVVSAYFYGFSFIDYINERRKMNIRESILFVRTYKWLAVANGSIFTLFLLIPGFGVFLSGIAAIIAVVAATLAVHEINSTKTAITFNI